MARFLLHTVKCGKGCTFVVCYLLVIVYAMLCVSDLIFKITSSPLHYVLTNASNLIYLLNEYILFFPFVDKMSW